MKHESDGTQQSEVVDQPNVAELPKLGGRTQIRDNSSGAGEIRSIDLDKIIVREGFNVREDMGDLEGLGISILENGQVMPGRVDVLEDGTFALTDGHRRYGALLLLKEKGHEPKFQAVVNTSRTSEEERILQMFTTQDNKQLTPYECAKIIGRLGNMGHKQADIARKIGKTPSYVSQMMDFNSEPHEIKELVRTNAIALSNVVKLKKDIPNEQERITAVQEAVKNAGTANADGTEKTKSQKRKAVTAKAIANKVDERYAEVANALVEKYPAIHPNSKKAIIKILKEHLG